MNLIEYQYLIFLSTQCLQISLYLQVLPALPGVRGDRGGQGHRGRRSRGCSQVTRFQKRLIVGTTNNQPRNGLIANFPLHSQAQNIEKTLMCYKSLIKNANKSYNLHTRLFSSSTINILKGVSCY